MLTGGRGIGGDAGHANVAGLLKRVGLFESLEEGHLAELVRRARRRRLDRGQTLFLQGDPANGLYVVLSGRIKVFKTSAKGREQTLMLMGSGDPVGEVAVLSGENYPASAEALEPSEVLYMPRQAFLDLVAREPEIALRLLGALSSRLRTFTRLIEDLSLREVAERLAAHLLILAGEGEADQVVDLTVSKTQLSAAVGTVPETLSRAFRQLSVSGAVETKGRKVFIKDRALLEKMARSHPR